MPLYEYNCPRCGSRFTRLQPMSAPREGHVCPDCGSTQTRRLISTFSQTGCGFTTESACGPAGSPFR